MIQIYQDSREKKPYSFSRRRCTVTEQRLKTGDYCIQGDGKMEGKTFHPNFAIERKSEDDFLQSITSNRDRFERELERADSFEHRMPIIIEETQQYFNEGRYYPDVHPNAVIGTIESHPSQYYVDYYFCRNRQRASQNTFDWLEWRDEQMEWNQEQL